MKRTIFIYLYRLNGEPMYVGQALNVELRDKQHCKGSLPFEKFLRKTGRKKFMLEIIGSVHDVPHGMKACKLENQMMDKFKTYWPTFKRGYNFGRAVMNHTQGSYEAMCAAQKAACARPEMKLRRSRTIARPEYKLKLSRAMKAACARPEMKLRRSRALKAAFARPEVKLRRSRAMKKREKYDVNSFITLSNRGKTIQEIMSATGASHPWISWSLKRRGLSI